MRRRPRPRTIAIGALIVLLAAAPFVPRGGGDHGVISPSGDRPHYVPRAAEAAGYSKVTPAMKAEIARVVDSTPRTLPRMAAGRIPTGVVDGLVKCADFDGQRYCLGQGWTTETEQQVQARVAADVAPLTGRRATKAKKARNTGDLSETAELKRLARMSPAARAKAETKELTQAARAVAKVWLIRHEIQGVPLPADFLAEHPEARTTASSAAGRVDTNAVAAPAAATPSVSPTVLPVGAGAPTTAAPTTTAPAPVTATTTAPAAPSVPTTYPVKAKILKNKQTAEQIRTYWCGPTSMQMITWGWKQKDKGAAHWAKKLGTTTAGTAITSMVRVVNNSTGWDKPTYAGPYTVLDVKSFTSAQFFALMQKHIAQYRAPVILHPLLLTRYFPYLDHNGGGHFQVGRGYKTNKHGTQMVGYFEPWNQQRFHPSEPFIARVQWAPASRELAAIKANSLHNIGV
ncbi:C39 family peptidase [Nocardioides sp.]|jgi:hypothetical protein|uniref:C39 family peptidase n=1 Tax=Nocardioides sp. TaxID=35761 RepID=UPI002CEF6F1F|nr:C39 family peptidase [Nocardioides sp.]HVX53025.1 C39 family peptidase [Nocardioides sp.]